MNISKIKILISIIVIILIYTSSITIRNYFYDVVSEGEEYKESEQINKDLDHLYKDRKECPDAEISWVDTLKINDIRYESNKYRGDTTIQVENGNEIGKVSYTMAGYACSDHKMKNGDATYLDINTPIYEVRGYPSNLIVSANNQVYVVYNNMKAKTADELFPMKNFVNKIYIQSTDDGSRIHTFSQFSKNMFLEEWYKLKLRDVQTLIDERKLEGKRIFLEIELNNGITFWQTYWIDTNTFHSGVIGNEKIKRIVGNELKNINQSIKNN
ncbi:MAG: hypothetical protein K0S51_1183 [Bacillales bacterium]|jgi:hypothetical protein|nr:hypothetical protein [Bacillales bacterium]